MRNFVVWCKSNQLNTSKTKEMVVDFGKSKLKPRPVPIKCQEVEVVETYIYLGLWLDNKLDWADNSRQLYKKAQSRLYFLQMLRSFNVCREFLKMFHHSVVASVISYTVMC